MSQFKEGDTLRLKSGGPLMTVTSLSSDTQGRQVVNTTWFAGDVQKFGQFAAATLSADDGGPVIA